jgi:hypothetical protein
LADNITEWLQRRYKNAPSGFTGPSIPGLKTKLHEMVRNAVDDFRHGMVGEERLAQDPVVNIVNTITNSPGAVQQNVVGQDNQQSVQQQSLFSEFDKLVSSEEFKQLPEQDRLAVKDLVDTLGDEIKKPKPDLPKIARWGRRLIEFVQQLGLDVAAAAIAKLLFGV